MSYITTMIAVTTAEHAQKLIDDYNKCFENIKNLVTMCTGSLATKEKAVFIWKDIDENQHPYLWVDICNAFDSNPESELLRMGEDEDDFSYACGSNVTDRVIKTERKVNIDLGGLKYEY